MFQDDKDNIFKFPIIKAIIITFVLLCLTILPISPTLYSNICSQKYCLYGVQFSLFVCLLYSLVTPGIVGIIRKEDINIIHKSFTILFTLLLVLILGITLDREIQIVTLNKYFELWLLLFAIILLFFSSYKDEKDSIGDLFNKSDAQKQSKISDFSTNLKNLKESNNE